MLTHAQNRLLTETNAGTPCGEMMRRYWHPVYLSSELVTNAPVPLRVLGEDLVLFRGDDGRPALLDRFCPHRGVDLSYGRVEPEGLRCIYHGWLFSASGTCLQQPNEPAGSTFYERIRQRAYPCVDAGGLIMAYMGPGEAPPLPQIPFLHADPAHVWVTKRRHECNFIQASDVDPSHLSFLHVLFDTSLVRSASNQYLTQDAAPQTICEDTAFGLRVYSVRHVAGDQQYVRLTNFIMPSVQTFVGAPIANPRTERPSDEHGYWLHWHVPIDDASHWKYIIAYRADAAIDAAYHAGTMAGEVDEQYRPVRTLENRFLQDRAEMRTRTYSGLGNSFQDQDRLVCESAGRIYDRTKEHLGASDRPMIEQRKRIFDAIADVCDGKTPLAAHVPEQNPFDDLVTVSARLANGKPVRGFWRSETVAAVRD